MLRKPSIRYNNLLNISCFYRITNVMTWNGISHLMRPFFSPLQPFQRWIAEISWLSKQIMKNASKKNENKRTATEGALWAKSLILFEVKMPRALTELFIHIQPLQTIYLLNVVSKSVTLDDFSHFTRWESSFIILVKTEKKWTPLGLWETITR